MSDQDAPWTVKISLVLPLEVRYATPLRSQSASLFQDEFESEEVFSGIEIRALGPMYVVEVGRACERERENAERMLLTLYHS